MSPADFSPAQAYWNQRFALAASRERITALIRAVATPRDMAPYQFAQLMAAALDFRPDLIVELGRGNGNSTCALNEAVNLAGDGRVVSLCRTPNWRTTVAPRVQEIVPASWFAPLEAVEADILQFDFAAVLAQARRILLFWDAHGFDVAECVLGSILPPLAAKEHLVLVHDLVDMRYAPPDVMRLDYGDGGLWKGGNSGPSLVLGTIGSPYEEGVALVDFTSRNRLALICAEHSFHTEFSVQPAKAAEMERLLGTELFSLNGLWAYFTLNEHPGPYTFPRFIRPAR